MTEPARRTISPYSPRTCPTGSPNSYSSFGFPVSGFRAKRGFTVVELMIVVGLIVLLIGILLPTISKVRRAGYIADTQQELSQLGAAINEYYSVFHAYPGPFSNDQIDFNATDAAGNSGFLMEIYNSASGYAYPTTKDWNSVSGTTYPSTYNVTGTENLVLGLLGGLNWDNTNPATPLLAYKPNEVGLGPLNLNQANPRRYSAFIDTKNIIWCSLSGMQVTQSNVMPATPTNYYDIAGHAAADSPIPVFVDRFPQPMPLLYLRARTGAKGVISDGSIGPNGAAAPPLANYQYDLRDIYGYVGNQNNLISLGLVAGNSHNLAEIGTAPSNTWPPTTGLPPRAGTFSTATKNNYCAFTYFANFGYTPSGITNATPSPALTNYTAQPRSADQYILISAGPDGIYGTSDDITSFGDVSQ
jgi:type II secretory pathway pseudopilin PulG